MRTIVFPRNQYTPEYLRAARLAGFDTFRGNPASALYRSRTRRQMKATLLRGSRLVDAYFGVSGTNVEHVHRGNCEPTNVPASRFLHPYRSGMRFLEAYRFGRIARAMELAARTGALYHLWWHPHNFGVHLPENLAFLRRILMHYARLNREYGMESLNMAEVTDRMELEADAGKIQIGGARNVRHSWVY